MNYLAHLVLSGDDDEVIFGNFIADVVKGSKYTEWTDSIQKGILLHRFIDTFTDQHPAYLSSKRRFYKKFPKISGVITDILYDHLLWCNWEKHLSYDPNEFIAKSYECLDKKKHLMPSKISFMYTYMKRDDWLSNYKHELGIRKALSGIGKRIGFGSHIHKAYDVFDENRALFHAEFDAFFPSILTKCNVFLL